MAFDPADHFTRDVDTGGFFYSFQPWRRIHFHHQRPAISTQNIHTSNVQRHRSRGFYRDFTLLWCDTGDACRAATMQIGTKIALFRPPFNRSDYFIANNQTADIAPLRLFDIFLHQNMRVQTAESVNHAFRRLTRLRQHDANSLRAFNQLDHQRRTTDHVD